MKMFAFALGAGLLSSALTPGDASTGTLRVYVGAAKLQPREPDKATKQELKVKAEAASKARRDLEKEIKSQYGKKREAWPPDRQEAVLAAEEAASQAGAAYHYLKVDPKALADSAEDIRKKLAGKGMLSREKKNVVQVATPEEADLVVEIVGRRSEKVLPTDLRAAYYWICFTITGGGKLDPSRLARIPRDWMRSKWGRNSWKIQSYSPETPFWKLESYAEERWSDAADEASAVIDDLIETHYAVLTGDGK